MDGIQHMMRPNCISLRALSSFALRAGSFYLHLRSCVRSGHHARLLPRRSCSVSPSYSQHEVVWDYKKVSNSVGRASRSQAREVARHRFSSYTKSASDAHTLRPQYGDVLRPEVHKADSSSGIQHEDGKRDCVSPVRLRRDPRSHVYAAEKQYARAIRASTRSCVRRRDTWNDILSDVFHIRLPESIARRERSTRV